MSQTTVEFRLEVDTQTAVNDVKDAVERIRSDLARDRRRSGRRAHRCRRAGDPHLCRLGAGHDDRGAVLVRRRHGHPQAAGLEGRRARRPLRRRDARDQGRARSRPAERARRHGRRRQPRAAARQRRHDRRQRQFRQPRPVDPHARRRRDRRRTRSRAKFRSAAAARSSCPTSLLSPTPGRSRNPSPASTTARSCPSPSSAARARAMSRSTSA